MKVLKLTFIIFLPFLFFFPFFFWCIRKVRCFRFHFTISLTLWRLQLAKDQTCSLNYHLLFPFSIKNSKSNPFGGKENLIKKQFYKVYMYQGDIRKILIVVNECLIKGKSWHELLHVKSRLADGQYLLINHGQPSSICAQIYNQCYHFYFFYFF